MQGVFANELERCLTGNSFAAPPADILEGIDVTLAHRAFPSVPHTIYAELWHIAIWQEISLDWVSGIPRPNLASAAEGFPTAEATARESWQQLCERYFLSLAGVAAVARDPARFELAVECPACAGDLQRTMTVREQLESMAGHSAYHFGRIVMMRQMAGCWPPLLGGFTW